MTDLELMDAIQAAGSKYDGHVTNGSCGELMRLFKRLLDDEPKLVEVKGVATE